jgi:hypothetical protein
MSTPNPSGATVNELNGVSCTSASACTAVGDDYPSAHTEVTLAERWNGKAWAIQATPNPSGATHSELEAVSCTPARETSASACTAVGYYYNSKVSPILAERWNGKAWAIQATPAGIQGYELGVSCTSASACTAVGYYVNSAGNVVTLAERWNGKAWAIQATPNPVTSYSYLDGVSCPSASVCTAVGYYDNTAGYTQTLAERWNGKAWAIQSAPNFPGDYVQLYGVSCTSASACTAVGGYVTVAGSSGTLAERWNGKAWAMQSTPSPNGDELYGVSCTSASACTAVGSYYYSVAERWNGKAWAVQATPTPSGASGTFLNGVSCLSASACTAAGSYNNSAGAAKTLAERYGPS